MTMKLTPVTDIRVLPHGERAAKTFAVQVQTKEAVYAMYGPPRRAKYFTKAEARLQAWHIIRHKGANLDHFEKLADKPTAAELRSNADDKDAEAAALIEKYGTGRRPSWVSGELGWLADSAAWNREQADEMEEKS